MFRDSFVILMFVIVLSALGCGSGAPANSTASSNANIAANTEVKTANMPPGFSTIPITPAANTPGISANVTPLPKGGKPTPGIPSEAELRKPFKPGPTPIPGIPDSETLRKAMGRPQVNVNVPPAKGSDVPMMKSNKVRRPQ